jgi:hypothetical protein
MGWPSLVEARPLQQPVSPSPSGYAVYAALEIALQGLLESALRFFLAAFLDFSYWPPHD